MKELKVGEKAPFFEGVIQTGKKVSLDNYKGKKLILFFYPKDNTPTCTVESCNLAENYARLKKKGFSILGISADTEKSHQKFKAKFNLPYDLIADTEHKILEDYGCWGWKKFMGREFIGIHRKTFVVNEDGVLIAVIHKVKSKDHAAQILEEIAE